MLERVSGVSRNTETVQKQQKQKGLSAEMIKAMEWLEKHPDMQGLSLRKAGEAAGVSYSTIRRAKDMQ